MSAPRLYIGTRDPRDGGGVASMSRFVYRVAEDAGYDPCLVFNRLDRASQVRLTNPLNLVSLDIDSAVERIDVNGLEGKGISLIFPEIEFTQYVLNGSAWRAATDDADLCFAVGGANLCGLPFARAGRRFGSWTATPLWADRVDRLNRAPAIERLRDRLSKPVLESLERRTFEAADPIFLLSQYTATRLERRYGFTSGDYEVVPYPVDIERFSPTPDEQSVETRGPTILFVGRLNDPRKNVELLIEAFDAVVDEHASARLWLIGADPNASLRRAVDRHDLTDAVEFHGTVPNEELPRYYRAADVFAIPSRQEGLGIVGLESMSCGTPVVSTRCGGPEDYVIDGEVGYLVPNDDAGALADRLSSLLEDDRRRTEFGESSRELIVSEYAESVIAERFIDAFERLESA